MTNANDSLVFLTVRGTLVPRGLEAACKVHNETAGSPDGIAAARALGDLSHKVYAPVPGIPGASQGELLFFDWWKTAEGIGTFFSDPRVHGMASQLFSQREGTVWMPARGAFGFDLPAPASRPDRYVGMVRCRARSRPSRCSGRCSPASCRTRGGAGSCRTGSS
jgi:hypothetical protein